MGKLKLKRTPEEQAAHEARKARKAARKAAKTSRTQQDDDNAYDYDERESSSRKRRRTEHGDHDFDFVFDHDLGQPSSSGAADVDFESVLAELEEARFREKMSGAFEDDERLDSVEARLNSYAHIPRRWRGGGMDRMDDELDIDPQMMEDEDYAEWVRAGMWRYVVHIAHSRHVAKLTSCSAFGAQKETCCRVCRARAQESRACCPKGTREGNARRDETDGERGRAEATPASYRTRNEEMGRGANSL